MYKNLVRPILFRLARGDAEAVHERTLALLAAFGSSPRRAQLARRLLPKPDPSLRREVFGVSFPSPLGLAAGMDKNGVALPAWALLGFGFVEVGTVTWHAQPGNERPRLFRLVDDEALINRLGFNNAGAAALATRLQRLQRLSIPVGISLGKSRVTPLDQATDDYCASLRALYHYGDYFAINVSSPNTPGLRALQDREHLDALLAALQRENTAQSQACGSVRRPLLVKIAPDLSDHAIIELLAVCAAHDVAGLIATNTTVSRDGLRGTDATRAQAGGLSGRPLAARAREVVRFVQRETGGQLPIIGVGGIFTGDDAARMLDAGASLVQVYTGFVYEGPTTARRVNRALAQR